MKDDPTLRTVTVDWLDASSGYLGAVAGSALRSWEATE